METCDQKLFEPAGKLKRYYLIIPELELVVTSEDEKDLLSLWYFSELYPTLEPDNSLPISRRIALLLLTWRDLGGRKWMPVLRDDADDAVGGE